VNMVTNIHLLSVSTVLVFLLMSIRFVGLMMSAQWLRQMPVPLMLRAAFPFSCALLLLPVYKDAGLLPVLNMWALAWLALQEFLIGSILGMAVNMMTNTVQMAGHLVSTQMGLEVTEMIDPTTQSPTPITGRLYSLFAMLLFFTLGFHRTSIFVLSQTFEWFPPGHSFDLFMRLAQESASAMTNMMSLMLNESMRLALPVFGSLLVLEIAIALVSKTVPQMNIFMIAMPLKVLFGCSIILMTLSLLGDGIVVTFQQFSAQWSALFPI
jgi:flagellar biosynthesis protein FliR